MAIISIFMAILAVSAYSLFLSEFTQIKKGVLPLVVICASICAFCLFGYANLLFVCGILWYVLAAAGVVAVILKNRKTGIKKVFANFFSLDIVLFLCISVAVTVILAINAPMLTRWDEFSFWGSAAKILKMNDQLYTFGAYTFTNKLGYPAGLPLLTYIFGFLSPTFVEWAAMAAYDILMVAVFTAVVAGVNKKYYKLSIFIFFVLFSLPFMFELANANQLVLFSFRTLYSEMPIGILFGGIIAVYFAQKQKNVGTFLSIGCCLAALSLIKDVGFVLAVIAVFCIGVDMLFVQRKDIKIGKLTGFFATVIICLCLLAICIVGFFSWTWHTAAVVNIDRTNVGALAPMSMFEVVATGLKELVGINRTDRFSSIFKSMITAFFNIRLTSLGSSFATLAVIFAVFAISVVCGWKNKKGVLSTVLVAVSGTVGLLGMMLFQLFAYVYVFGYLPGLNLADYARYFSVYYIGFFIVALCRLCLVQGEYPENKLPMCAITGLFACFVALNAYTFYGSQTFLQKYINTDNQRKAVAVTSQEIVNYCKEKDDKVYIISQGDNSSLWYHFAYETLPVYIEKAVDGTIELPTDDNKELINTTQMTVKDFCTLLETKKCNYIYLNKIDEYVSVEMRSLFTDDLQGYESGQTRLYKITQNSNEMAFSPMLTKAVANEK